MKLFRVWVGFAIAATLLAAARAADFSTSVTEEYQNRIKELRSAAKSASAINPATSVALPQLANGVLNGTRFVTSIAITNSTSNSTTATLQLFQSNGDDFNLALYESTTGNFVGRSSQFSVPIGPFRTVFLETDGIGGAIVGWGLVTAPIPVGATASFQLSDAISRNLFTIVGVGGSSASPGFFIPVFKDARLVSNTALALSNNSNSTVRLQLFLFSNDGSSGTTFITIGPFQNYSRYVDEIFQVGSRFFGTLHAVRVDASGQAVSRLDVSPLALFTSNGILTSVPATNLVAF